MNYEFEELGLIEEEFICDLDGFTITEEDERRIQAMMDDRWEVSEKFILLI